MLYWRIYLYTEWRVGSGIVTLAILLFLNTMPLAIERPAPHCHWPIFNLFNMKYRNFLSLNFRRIWKCSGQGPDKNRYCTVFFLLLNNFKQMCFLHNKTLECSVKLTPFEASSSNKTVHAKLLRWKVYPWILWKALSSTYYRVSVWWTWKIFLMMSFLIHIQLVICIAYY